MDRLPQEVQTASACIPNIGRRGRLLRTAGAVVALGFGLFGAAQVIVAHRPRAELFGPTVLFFVASLAWFQAREKT
jgi:hypothetical protein